MEMRSNLEKRASIDSAQGENPLMERRGVTQGRVEVDSIVGAGKKTRQFGIFRPGHQATPERHWAVLCQQEQAPDWGMPCKRWAPAGRARRCVLAWAAPRGGWAQGLGNARGMLSAKLGEMLGRCWVPGWATPGVVC
ncbi:unnamed protein product [Ilex paraguariensis]|uniref:Uncharacterized protein n=1 Tax=Ilex paraguariensis TaxID=185542 RepID=A0ABC8S351_9AQUA